MLGGGGVTGVAWEIGLLAGLADRWLELGPADLLVGTSAGAAHQAAEMTRAGRAATVISPDPAAAAAIGRNVLDPARRAPAARAGYAQAGPALDRVGTVWNG